MRVTGNMFREKSLPTKEYARICRCVRISELIPARVPWHERIRIVRKYENMKLTDDVKNDIANEFE